MGTSSSSFLQFVNRHIPPAPRPTTTDIPFLSASSLLSLLLLHTTTFIFLHQHFRVQTTITNVTHARARTHTSQNQPIKLHSFPQMFDSNNCIPMIEMRWWWWCR